MSNSKQIRVAVYIDGSNFYYRLKELGIKNISKYNYRSLSEWLANSGKIISCRYYVGAIRAKPGDKKGQELRKLQQKLFSHLEVQDITVKTGYLMKSNNVYHEKGVDVKIATDLLVGAYDDMYDKAIVLSSDTDLIPAIKKVMHLGKKVEYVGFNERPSYALLRNTSSSRLLKKAELVKFQQTHS